MLLSPRTATVLLGATIATAVVSAASVGWGPDLVVGAVGVVNVSLALFIALRVSRESGSQWLALFLACLGAAASAALLAPVSGDSWRLVSNACFALVAPGSGALVRFASHFEPDGPGRPSSIDDPPAHGTRLVDRAAVPAGAALGAGYWFAAWLRLPGWPTVAMMLLMLFVAVGAGRATVLLFRYHSTADVEDAARIKWVLLAASVWFFVLGAYFTAQVFGLVENDSVSVWIDRGAAALAVVGSGILAFGMVARGSLDPSFLLRRSLLVGSLGLSLVFVLGVTEAALSDALLGRLGLPSGAGIWIAAGVMAVVAHPLLEWLRPRLQARLDSWELGRDDGVGLKAGNDA